MTDVIEEAKKKMQDKMPEEINFALTRKIPYAFEGETVDGGFIRLIAPSHKQLIHCTELKQAFMRSMSEMDQKYSPSEIEDMKRTLGESGSKMDAAGIISTLYMSKTVDMVKVLLNAVELFKSGVAKLDGVQELNKPLVDLMLQEDLERMTGEYMVNFILRSVLKELN